MHVSVLFEEVMEYLQPRSGSTWIDCTVGSGGHALGLLERSTPGGPVLGLDRDVDALRRAEERLKPFEGRFELVHASFGDLADVAHERSFTSVDGVLFDLGLSSDQLEASGRGFSFQRPDEPLDMRFDVTAGPSAADILNRESEEDLARIFHEYGEEPRARRLARSIVAQRRGALFSTVGDLLQAVRSALGPKRGRIHPATRAFQALRIATNDELETLKRGLLASFVLLKVGGRVAVISFHSLEDRIVKYLLRDHAGDQAEPRLNVLTRKPVVPTLQEQTENPRSRSAKLRVAERV